MQIDQSVNLEPSAAGKSAAERSSAPFRHDIFSHEEAESGFNNGVQILRYIDPRLQEFLPQIQLWSQDKKLNFCEDLSLNSLSAELRQYLLNDQKFPTEHEQALELWIEHMRTTFLLSHPEASVNPERRYAVVLSRTTGSDQSQLTPRTDWHVDEHFTAKPGSPPIRQALVVYCMYPSTHESQRKNDQFDFGTTEYSSPDNVKAEEYLLYRKDRRLLLDKAYAMAERDPAGSSAIYKDVINLDQNADFLIEPTQRERLPIGVVGLWQAIPGLKDNIHPAKGLLHRTTLTTQSALKFLT